MAVCTSYEAKGQSEAQQVHSVKSTPNDLIYSILLQSTANCKVITSIEFVKDILIDIMKQYFSTTDVHLSHKLYTSIKCTPSNVKGILSAETCNEVQKLVDTIENLAISSVTKNLRSIKKKDKKALQKTKVQKHLAVGQENKHHKKVPDSTKKSALSSLWLNFLFLGLIVCALVVPTSAESYVKFSQEKYSASKGAALKIQWNGTIDDKVFVNDLEIGYCNSMASWYCEITVNDIEELKSKDMKLKKIGNYLYSYELEISDSRCFLRNVTVVPTGEEENEKTADIIVAGCQGNTAAMVSGPHFGWVVLVALSVLMSEYMLK